MGELYLPLEILQYIVWQVPSGDRVTLSRLCLASSSLYHFAAPRLYRSLYLNFEGKERSRLDLLNTLLEPGYDARWKKWVKSVSVTAQKNSVEMHERQDVCGSLAEVLSKIERGSLDKFSWGAFFAPHKQVVDALVGHKKLRCLQVAFPFDPDRSSDDGEETDTIFKALPEENYHNLETLEIRKAWTKEQMTAAAKAIGSPGLKNLTLHMSYFFDWDLEHEFSRLPPRPNDERSRLVLIDLSGISLCNAQPIIDSYFNPSTLRKLELRDCVGYESVCLALSQYPGVLDIEELVLISWEDCGDISSIIRLVAKCKHLKVLCLDLSSFTPEEILKLIPAFSESGKTLEVLSLCLRDNQNWHGESIYYPPKALHVMKSFENLREIGMSYAIPPTDLYKVVPTLPPSVRAADLRFPWTGVTESREHMTHNISAFAEALPAGNGLIHVIVGDDDDYSDPLVFKMTPTVHEIADSEKTELRELRLKCFRSDWF
ncbi:hypothetical protein C7212DRAFT_364189 [Tuber magnatum]|uniref:F-box domain-containing protein n=1 Tax=Tuber magnatum TaxID=42249 RepID=A0A317SMA4_9PEZI|nr:hypothetical protein C7212DRAFT_364189 [Tuber magnatum]